MGVGVGDDEAGVCGDGGCWAGGWFGLVDDVGDEEFFAYGVGFVSDGDGVAGAESVVELSW